MMTNKTVGLVAFVLGVLLGLAPTLGRAEVAGTGTFDIDVDGFPPNVTFDGDITFDNTAHDVGGTSVNLGTGVGMMTYSGSAVVNTGTLSATFDVTATDTNSPFSFTGAGGGACVNACIGGSATFAGALDSPITDPNTVLPDDFTYTFDGTISIGFSSEGAGGTLAINAFAPVVTGMGTDVMAASGPTTFFDTRAEADKTFDAVVVFDQVTTGGTTTFIGLTAVPGSLPAGISLDSAVSRFVDIVTTADSTGMIEVCFNFPDTEPDGIIDGTSIALANLRVLHKADGSADFVDVTTTGGPGQVCGLVSSLSPFVVAVAAPTTTTTVAETTTTITSTTSSTTTSTTLPLGPCTDGVACLSSALGTSLCGSEAIHPKLRAIIKMKLKKAKALLTKAANADATKAAKLVTKARAQITLVATKADAFAARAKKPISTDCRDGIVAALEQIEQAITDNPPGGG
jgi:hypothetical protein